MCAVYAVCAGLFVHRYGDGQIIFANMFFFRCLRGHRLNSLPETKYGRILDDTYLVEKSYAFFADKSRGTWRKVIGDGPEPDTEIKTCPSRLVLHDPRRLFDII